LILDYARSKEKNWKRKEMEKGFMIENGVGKDFSDELVCNLILK
jgi:hypothetical protein